MTRSNERIPVDVNIKLSVIMEPGDDEITVENAGAETHVYAWQGKAKQLLLRIIGVARQTPEEAEESRWKRRGWFGHSPSLKRDLDAAVAPAGAPKRRRAA